MESIRQLAKQFRDAIDTAHKHGDFDDDIVFKDFPRGCCGDTSDLLAEFLKENGISVCYVCGIYVDNTFEKGRTHAWLVTNNDIIIDITGDQFKDNPIFLNYDISTYVGPRDKFHDLFKVYPEDVRESSDINGSDEFWSWRLKKIYSQIIQYIK